MPTPAETTISRFGGVRKLARELGVNPSTVCRWRNGDGQVPQKQWGALLACAQRAGVALLLNDLLGELSVANSATPDTVAPCSSSDQTNQPCSPASGTASHTPAAA